ncbi:MAG: hypothetical protein JKY19_02330 [Alcanivoracaceae bacterium]|nr:hypothetical protein [Alcanivoracaceae bacterium]
MKVKKIISLLGLDKSTIGMFCSYCHLLQHQLDNHWIVDKTGTYSDIVVIAANQPEFTNIKARIKIILGRSDTQSIDDAPESDRTFKITYPINSSKVLDILNKVSKIENRSTDNKNILSSKTLFSLKNMFLKYVNKNNIGNKFKQVNTKINQSHKIANKLLKLRPSSNKNNLKVVFLGRPGSGKTTAISSASTDQILTSEVNATDTVGLIKDQTTIGIDYGEYLVDDDTKLRLYGTPGQVRYDYVQTQTVARADIYVILVDLSSVAPFAEFMHYKKIIESAGNSDALRVVAFTHYDVREHNMLLLSKEIRYKYHGETLTVKIDTRQTDEMRFMLKKAAMMILDNNSLHQHYEENSLYLRNINS